MVRSIHRRDQMIEEAKTGVSEDGSPVADSDARGHPDDNPRVESPPATIAVWLLRISLLALPLLALAIVLMQ